MAEKEKKNPFEAIHDMYVGAVEEADKKNSPEINKECIEAILNEFRQEGFNAIDIEYLDGYYIFGMGTNSVCHFHIEGLDDWKFGIWLKWDEKDTKQVKYYWFAQVERFIDKFKPAASMIHEDSSITFLEDDQEAKYQVNGWEAVHFMKFIKEHPYLAMWRDISYTDYNKEYITPRVAKKRYLKAVRDDDRRKKWQAYYDKQCVKRVKKVLAMFPKVKLVEMPYDECCTPGYEIILEAEVGLTIDEIYGIKEHIEDLISEVIDAYKYKHRDSVFQNIPHWVYIYKVYKNGNKKLVR